MHPIAVEPNAAMMRIGMLATFQVSVSWKLGAAQYPEFESRTPDWVTFGASDRAETLREFASIAKPGTFFTCMRNHFDRD